MNYSKALLPTIVNRYQNHSKTTPFSSISSLKSLQFNTTINSNNGKFMVKNLSK